MWGQAAWCIVSSPLILSHDLTNDTTMDSVWSLITNREALAVNEAWVGDAGVLVKKSDELLPFTNCQCQHPTTSLPRALAPLS